MKYIRTKNEIYEVVKEGDEWVDIISNFERKMKCHCVIKKHAIINQADTIEELCDEFVAIDKETGHKDLVDYFDYNSLEKNEYYGAIWTGWGLKYVAKMNEKGELELI